MSTDMIKVRALQTQQGKNKVFSFLLMAQIFLK